MEKDLERSDHTGTPQNGEVSAIVVESGGLKRDLSSRHINMIAIAGMIVGPCTERLSSHRDINRVQSR